LPATTITLEAVQQFAKNAVYLKVIHYRSLADEFGKEAPKLGDNIPVVDYQTMLPGDGIWYLVWRAAWRFHEKVGRSPGEKTKAYLDDVEVRLVRPHNRSW